MALRLLPDLPQGTDAFFLTLPVSEEAAVQSNRTFDSLNDLFDRDFIGRLPAMAPMAIGMVFKKGMSPLPPKRIKGMGQLKKILKRAKELEAA